MIGTCFPDYIALGNLIEIVDDIDDKLHYIYNCIIFSVFERLRFKSVSLASRTKNAVILTKCNSFAATQLAYSASHSDYLFWIRARARIASHKFTLKLCLHLNVHNEPAAAMLARWRQASFESN